MRNAVLSRYEIRQETPRAARGTKGGGGGGGGNGGGGEGWKPGEEKKTAGWRQEIETRGRLGQSSGILEQASKSEIPERRAARNLVQDCSFP